MLKSLKARLTSAIMALAMVLTIAPVLPQKVYAAEDYNGGWAIANTSVNVYSNSSGSSKIGTIYANEGFTILSQSGNTMHVEYSTSKGAKQGYLVNPNITSEVNSTSVAKVTSNTNTYYGPSSSNYASAGSVYAGEFVAVLQRERGWSFIEYNTNSGRKRAYVPDSTLNCYNSHRLSGFSLDAISSGLTVYITGTAPVYSGPSSMYPQVGSVSNETVPYCAYVGYNGSSYWYVEYYINGTNQKKTGYVKM